ncbi:MAG TPA: sugar phosphate isomerase/epimerase [Gemmataceae bacterium]|nr:sugar phosphate isomerase/epimerase [Gemmataceae bacterium]
MENAWTRREWLRNSSAVLGAGIAIARPEVAQASGANEPFGYCLNTSTIQGQKRDLIEVVEIAARAGYQGIEPWIHELDQHAKQGGDLKALGQRIRDRGLTVESAIGFSEWIVDDDARRKKGLEDFRRSMGIVQKIGGKRIAAPPAGATSQTDMNLLKAAERYRALLELGDQFGIVPQVELWGFSRTLGRLGEAMLVAMESGHPRACILPDVYHLYKGGSRFGSLKLISGSALHVIHLNDYPAQPPRDSITDAQRIYPGDGIAPLTDMLRDLRQIGFRGMLSLELFNRDYWKQDAATVARTGLEKMRAVVRAALG